MFEKDTASSFYLLGKNGKWLHGTVRRMAQQAGIGMPEVVIYESPDLIRRISRLELTGCRGIASPQESE